MLKIAYFTILTLLLLATNYSFADKPTWNITFILDQSGSMRMTDHSQYALLIPSIIADLSSEKDRVSIIGQDGCKIPPCPAIWELSVFNRKSFKASLEALPQDSNFTSPLLTALQRHHSSQGYDQSIVSLVYDNAAQDEVQAQQIRQMIRASSQDGYVFVMSNATTFQDLFGAENGSQVLDSIGLLKAYSGFFKKLFFAKEVPTGISKPDLVTVSIAPGSKETWLAFICNQEIKSILELTGNPSSSKIDVSPIGTGYTFPKVKTQYYSQDLLSYKLVYIQDPAAGNWSFQVNSSCTDVAWVNLSLYELPINEIFIEGQRYNGKAIECKLKEGCKVEVKVIPGMKPKGILQSGGDLTYHTNFVCDDNGSCTTTYYPRGEQDKNVTIKFETENAQAQKKLKLNPNTSGLGDATCPSNQSFIIPTKSEGTIFFTNYIFGNQVVSDAALQELTAQLELDGSIINGTEKQIHHPTTEDLAKMPQLSPSDWVVNYQFQGISSNEVKTVKGQALTVNVGKTSTCPLSFEFLPVVHLNLSSDSNYILLNECTLDKSELKDQSCSNCSACQEASLMLNYAGSFLSNPIKANLALSSTLPNGVSLFIDGKEVKSNEPIDVSLDTIGNQAFRVSLCSDFCPTSVVDHELQFTLSADHVLTRENLETPSSTSSFATVKLEVMGSKWWVCWWPSIILGLKCLGILFFLFGFVYPRRFPRSSKNNFPYLVKSALSKSFRSLNQQETYLRRAMPKIRWYRNDYAHLCLEGALLTVDNRSSHPTCEIILKGNKAYLITKSTSIYEIPYRSSMNISNVILKKNQLISPNVLTVLSTSNIYYDKTTDLWFLFEA